MRNVVAAEECGIPTVTVTTGLIVQMSTEQARTLGWPELPVVALDEALYGRPRAEIAELAAPYGEGVAAGLVA